MQGYYDSEHSGKGLETPTGQLNINVKNLPENRNKYKPFHITYKEVMQFETYIYFKTYTKRRWKSYF